MISYLTMYYRRFCLDGRNRSANDVLRSARTGGAECLCALRHDLCCRPRWGSTALCRNFTAGREALGTGAPWKNVCGFNGASNNRDYKRKPLSKLQPGMKVLITTQCIINKPQQSLEKLSLLEVMSNWQAWLLPAGTRSSKLGW